MDINPDCHGKESNTDGGELQHVAHRCPHKEGGVAPVQHSKHTSLEAAMSINNTVAGRTLSPRDLSPPIFSKTNSLCCSRRLNKKHLFGIILLVIVDLIWVGSAGLTKYLFSQEQYDKPFFTVYFKTVLFSIYLLPFLFWRPWQRLCCLESSSKRSRTTSSSAQLDHKRYCKEEEKVLCDDRVSADRDNTCVESSYFNSSAYSVCEDDKEKEKEALGPSEYTPLKYENPHYQTNSLSLPRKMTESATQLLTASSSAPLSRRKPNQVRFCQTVEVKTVSSPTKENYVAIVRKPVKLVSVRIVMILALIFGILWFFANYFYAKALETQSVAAVNTLSSLSGVFVLVLAAIPIPRLSAKDRFSLTKLAILILSVSGAVIVGLSHSSDKQRGISYGSLYAVGGACLYATYLVLLSKLLPDPESLEIPMFFGFVGLLDTFLLLPFLVSWHYLGIEKFEWPPTPNVWTLLLVNGFVGTVLSELLWLWGCLLTSSLVGTISLTLVMPLSLTYSIVVNQTSFSPLFIFGASLILAAFVMIAIVDHGNGWDPVWNWTKKLWRITKDRYYRDYDSLRDESKSLLEKSCSPDMLPDSP